MGLTDMVIIFVTCKNKKDAERTGASILKKRLAACFVVIPRVESSYWWKGKVAKANEAVLLAKTIKKHFLKIEHEVKKLHSYKVPCILEIPVSRASKIYLKWLNAVLAR